MVNLLLLTVGVANVSFTLGYFLGYGVNLKIYLVVLGISKG